MDADVATVLLGGTWFGAGLASGPQARLAALGHVVDYQDGTVVVQEGTPCRALGVVVGGRVALRLALPGGQARTILTIDPGDVFGWSAVLSPDTATSTGVAVGPTRAVVFDADDLRAALAVDCELAAAVYQRLLVSVARRLTATRMQLLDLYAAAPEPW